MEGRGTICTGISALITCLSKRSKGKRKLNENKNANKHPIKENRKLSIMNIMHAAQLEPAFLGSKVKPLKPGTNVQCKNSCNSLAQGFGNAKNVSSRTSQQARELVSRHEN